MTRGRGELVRLVRRTAERPAARYLLVGGASYVVDLGLFLTTGALGAPLLLAASIGYWTSVVFNFLANRAVVFAGRGSIAVSAVRYVLLLGVNYLVTLVVVSLLVGAGAQPAVAKTAAVALTTVWNFMLYRTWIFR